MIVTFAVANVRAIEKLAKKFAKVVKFPLKDVVFMHVLQTQPFARALAPAAAAEHLTVLLLLAQDASRTRLNLPEPLNALLSSAASTTTCGGCRAAMPAEHMVPPLAILPLSSIKQRSCTGACLRPHALPAVLWYVPSARHDEIVDSTAQHKCVT